MSKASWRLSGVHFRPYKERHGGYRSLCEVTSHDSRKAQVVYSEIHDRGSPLPVKGTKGVTISYSIGLIKVYSTKDGFADKHIGLYRCRVDNERRIQVASRKQSIL